MIPDRDSTAPPELAHVLGVERWCALFALLFLGAALLLADRRFQLGVVLGSGLMLLNLFLLRGILSRLFRAFLLHRLSTALLLVLLNLKLLVLGGVICLFTHYLKINPLSLILGVSVLPLGALCRAVEHSLHPAFDEG